MSYDNDLLAAFDKKLMHVRVRTRSVAHRYATGFYLWGEGGISKTWTVTKTLEDMGVNFKLTNTRITGRGLFDLLHEYPDIVHVLDDVETLFADRNSHGVLRAALDGDPKDSRMFSWHTGTDGRQVGYFTGGIIMIANSPLANVPSLRAIETRVEPAELRPTPEELAAKMREIAENGYQKLTPAACLEVVEAILERTAKMNQGLNLRMLGNTFRDRLQYEDGLSELHWKDLLESRIQQRIMRPTQPLSRVQREIEIVREIANLPRLQQLEKWKEATGKSQASMYRRLSDLSQNEKPNSDDSYLSN